MKFFWYLFLIFISSPVLADSPAWPTQGGAFERTGTSHFSGPEQGCIHWQFSTDGPVLSSIAIGYSGILYLPSEDGFLYAVDPNGVELWRYDARSAVTGAPAVDEAGTVYLGTADGLLAAVDPNGTEKWSFAIQGGIYACPALTDSLILAGSMDGTVYALDREGGLVWTCMPDHPDSIVAGLSVGPDGTIYFGRLYDPHVYALDPEDGSVLWYSDLSHYALPDDPTTNPVRTGFDVCPVVHPNGFVLAAPLRGSKLYALDPNDGDTVWSLNLYQSPQQPLNITPLYEDIFKNNYGYSDIWSEPVIGPDGTIYVSMDDMYLRAVNPDGTLKWTQRVGMYGGLTMTVDADGMIYGASDDKSLYVIEPEEGTILSVMTIYDTLMYAYSARNEEWLSFPVIGGDGLLYVSSSANKLYAVRAGDCYPRELHWIANLNGDDRVELADLAAAARDWQGCLNSVFFGQQCSLSDTWYPLTFPYLEADMNRDFYVNMDDLAIVVENWLKGEN